MGRTSRFGVVLRTVVLAGIVLFLSGCPEIFTDSLNSPLDPDATDYQGYYTVAHPDDMQPHISDGARIIRLRFVVSAVIGAESYHLQIATAQDFSSGTVIHDKADYPSNVMIPEGSEGFTIGTTYYWRSRASVSGLEPASWTQVRSFVFGYAIGDKGPAKGVIFFIDFDNIHSWTYLEAWTADEGNTYQWKTSWTDTLGTSTAIGSGFANTYTALSGSEHPAAQVARNATYGGFDDWFLPSSGELYLMYQHQEEIGGFTSDFYWSSSEVSSPIAWGQHFSFDYESYTAKDSSRRVRVIRAF